MQVVIVDCNFNRQKPHPVYVEMATRLKAGGVSLFVDNAWCDDYVAADLIIGADPIRDRESILDARILGQRTQNRLERMVVARDAGGPVPRFAAPRSEDELTALAREWGAREVVLKYDWSSRRNGVFLWPLGEARKPMPADFNPASDLVMEFIDGDPRTLKADFFAGTYLNVWVLATRDMHLPDWQLVNDRRPARGELSPDVVAALEAVSRALVGYGAGYVSFDLMLSQKRARIVEVNTSGVGTGAWDHWPERYAETYARAILVTLERLHEVPRYRDIRDRALASGSDASAPALPERPPAAQRNDAATQAAPSAARAQPQLPVEATFFRNLGVTERMPAAELASMMRSAVTPVLRHALDTAPFYRQSLARLFGEDGKPDWTKWEELGFTTRNDIRDSRHLLLSRTPPLQHGATTFVHTAGSTGPAIPFSRSRLARSAHNAIEARFHAWKEMKASATLVTAIPEAPARRTWAPPWATPPLGPLHRVPSDDAEAQLRWLAGLGPVYLQALPSQLRRMALAVSRQPGLKPDLLGVLTFGEVLTEDTRRLVEKHLGQRPFDSYGLVETGLLALQCPAGEGYHLQSELCVIEVLSDRGFACKDGEVGEIVATPIYNYPMPLVRYRTGDFAEMGAGGDGDAPCACGRHLPKLRRILGRRRNLLRFSGVPPFQPDVDSKVVFDLVGASDWQVAQTGPLDVEFRHNAPAASAEKSAALADYLGRKLPPVVAVTVKSVLATGLRLANGRLENYLAEGGDRRAR